MTIANVPTVALKYWHVMGTIIIPGTREKSTLDPIRIFAKDKQEASTQLATVLREKFSKELAQANRQRSGSPFTFSPHFAMMHLQWHPIAKPSADQLVEAANVCQE